MTAVGEEIKVFVDDMDKEVVKARDGRLASGKNAVVVAGSGTFDHVSIPRLSISPVIK